MLNLLFWNLNKKSLAESVGLLAEEREADIIVLAEMPQSTEGILTRLRQYNSDFMASDQILPQRRVILYYRSSSAQVQCLHDAKFWTIYQLSLSDGESLILVAVHMPAKSNRGYIGSTNRLPLFQQLCQDILTEERSSGTDRTIVVGDLNQNPFDNEVVHLDTLNAVMDPDVANRVSCQRDGQTYKYFYNPMWTAYGRSQAPIGTYYYQEPDYVRYYWHVFDQVLLRPDLIPALSNEMPTVITELRGESLLRANGRPDNSRFSDHLPIALSLNII
jgi:hypothetical protein